MKENGFYKIKQEYIDLIHSLGGEYKDTKERPVFCCIEDKFVEGLYWAIPTSSLDHRTPDQVERFQHYCNLPRRDIRWAYYYIGHTNRPALYRISNCLPITAKYIDSEYTSKGLHLELKNIKAIEEIRFKLRKILQAENRHPDKFEQKITSVKNKMIKELEEE